MKYEVKCGQILRLIDDKKYYNVGTNGELAIVLSCDNDAWSVGTFWVMRGGNKSCGGARVRELMEYEINEIFELVGHISEIEKGCVMDEHRKMAEEIFNKLNVVQFEAVSGNDAKKDIESIADLLRSTASKSEKDGWNEAIRRCMNLYASNFKGSFLDSLRRLIMEDGK